MARRHVVAIAGAVTAVGVAIGWRTTKRYQEVSEERPVLSRNPLLIEDIDADRFVSALRDAISHRTVVLDDGTYDSDVFDEFADMLAERYPRMHETLHRETFNEHGLLYTWVGSESSLDPIVLMAHQDVVPADEGAEDDWIAPPFSGSVVDGKIYGRGALDCKGPLIAMLEAIEYLLENGATPERTVYLVSGHDEEIGGRNGSAVIAEELRSRGVTPWFVVDEGGAVVDGALRGVNLPVALIGIAEKGFMNVKLTAESGGGHASLPSSESAIGNLAAAIIAIETSPVPARIDAIAPMLEALSDYLPGVVGVLASRPTAAASLLSRAFAKDERMDALQRTTMVPTVIEGGVKANVLPLSASVIVNVRVIPGDTLSDILGYMRSVVDDNIEVEMLPDISWEPSEFSSVESEAWRTLTGVIDEVFPSVITAPWVVTGATDSRFFEAFSGDVYRFSPFVLDKDGVDGFHGTNEFVRVADAKRAVSFFVRLIAVAAGTGDSWGGEILTD